MEERLTHKSKKNYNPLEEKLSSQIKRIEELLKSGDIPWPRVKSAYAMCQIAVGQMPQDIKGAYPIKQYVNLVQLIFAQFLQYVDDEGEDDPSNKIQSKLLGLKKYKEKLLGKQESEKDVSSSLNMIENQKSNILQRLKESNQSLVESQLKKVINSLDSAKASLIDELVKGQSKHKEAISELLKTELNDVLGTWKQQITEKYKQLNKWVEENKVHHAQSMKKKNDQIQKLLQQNLRKNQKSHCGVQTVSQDRIYDKRLKEKETQFNLEKQRFLRVTKEYEKEIMELKKYTKTLRTSSHLKLEEYEKNIVDLNKQIKHIKGQFKEYFQNSRQTQEIFLNIYQKHQKARTPFIPKSDIIVVYDKLKSKQRKQSIIYEMLMEQEKAVVEPSKNSIKSTDDNSRSKNKKQIVTNNEPLTNVADLPSKINSFQTGTKLRNSIKMVSKNPSFILGKEEMLPLIRTLESNSLPPLPKSPSSQNVRSLHEPKLNFKNEQFNSNYLSVDNLRQNDFVAKITSRKNLFDGYKQNISNSLYVEQSKELSKSPSRSNEIRSGIRPVVKPLSRHQTSKQNQSIDQIKVDKTEVVKINIGFNKKFYTQSNEMNKTFNLQNDDYTSSYIIKINKAEQEPEERHKTSMVNMKSKTIYIHNKSSTTKLPKAHRDTIKQPIYNNRKRDTKQNRDGREARETTKQMKQQSVVERVRNKPRKVTTNISSINLNIKEVNMTNFQRQMNLLLQKYQNIENYDDYDQEIEDGIQKVKKVHRLACTKQICHHLRKFENKMKRIRHQNSNKKPLKLAQLEIRHNYSL